MIAIPWTDSLFEFNIIAPLILCWSFQVRVRVTQQQPHLKLIRSRTKRVRQKVDRRWTPQASRPRTLWRKTLRSVIWLFCKWVVGPPVFFPFEISFEIEIRDLTDTCVSVYVCVFMCLSTEFNLKCFQNILTWWVSSLSLWDTTAGELWPARAHDAGREAASLWAAPGRRWQKPRPLQLFFHLCPG